MQNFRYVIEVKYCNGKKFSSNVCPYTVLDQERIWSQLKWSGLVPTKLSFLEAKKPHKKKTAIKKSIKRILHFVSGKMVLHKKVNLFCSARTWVKNNVSPTYKETQAQKCDDIKQIYTQTQQ